MGNLQPRPKLLDKVFRTQTTISRDSLISTPNGNGDTVHDETILENMVQYRSRKIREGTIDVYWLYDTGGLTLLIPFIISSR